MGKSYKKHPYSKIAGYGKQGKIYANRRVRRSELDTTERGSYKKLYCSWNIKDYISRYSYEQAAAYYRELERREPLGYIECSIFKQFPTFEDFMLDWEKNYRRK